MKKALSLILALALCVALAVPALAADTVAYGPVTVLDGGSVITFSQAATATRDIILARQTWYTGYTAPSYSESARKTVNLIITKPGSTITRSQSGTPLNLAFLSRVDAGYVVRADRLVSYATSFTSDQLFSGALGGADLCLLTLSDNTEYYIISGAAALVEAPVVDISYIVQAGDTLDAIALNYYGKENYGQYLREVNKEHFMLTGGVLEAGRALTLPATLNGVTRFSGPLATGGELPYVVKAGDNLASIAQRFYGNVKYVNNIVQRNADRIKNPALIQVGQILILPVIGTTGTTSSTGGTGTTGTTSSIGTTGTTGITGAGGMNYDET